MRVLWLLLIVGVLGGVYSMFGKERDRGDGFDLFAAGLSQEAPSQEDLSPDDPRRITGDTKIIMIAAEWCGYCRKQQKDFEQAGVRYRVLDYDQAEGKLASNALGTRGVPITVIGQNVVAGYRTDQLDAHLTPLGYDVY
jgi:glutaredoxin